MSASTRPVMAGDHSTLGDELILQISVNTFCVLNENWSPDQATISHIIRLLSLWFMCKNNNRLISDEQKILQTISLQDYVKRLWNLSNTKIPVTIGKGTDTAKPRSKAPHAGQWMEWNGCVLSLLRVYDMKMWIGQSCVSPLFKVKWFISIQYNHYVIHKIVLDKRKMYRFHNITHCIVRVAYECSDNRSSSGLRCSLSLQYTVRC